MCGLATYSSYLTRKSPPDQWGVLSFDLKKYGTQLTNEAVMETSQVWYGISGKGDYYAREIITGLDKLGGFDSPAVLWFQHESAIWPDMKSFVSMLKKLPIPKIVTFHTLHFQSSETPSGLRAHQNDLLQSILPYVDAITVFSQGVYWAVISAFPQYCTRIAVLKHGIHSYPEIQRMNRMVARHNLNEYLSNESDLDYESRRFLSKEKILTDPETIILGQTGFLCPLKQSESLCVAQRYLQEMLPGKRIVILRIGKSREQSHSSYAAKLRKESYNTNACLINMWLPDNELALAQKAFDINFYWPSDCTQSGIMAHALGTHAIIAGRDMEGVGETLRQSGELVDSNIKKLTFKIGKVIADEKLRSQIEKRAGEYAREYSWENQSRRHYELADAVTCGDKLTIRDASPTLKDPLVALATGSPNSEIIANPEELNYLTHRLENNLQSDYGNARDAYST